MAQMISYILGAVFVVIGLLGFVNDPVLGIFEVDMVHNLVHLVSGLVLLGLGYAGAGMARTGAKIFGVVYAVVAVWGLVVPGEMLLNIMQVNFADDILHVVIAAALLYAGFAGGGMSASQGPAGRGGMGGGQRMEEEGMEQGMEQEPRQQMGGQQ